MKVLSIGLGLAGTNMTLVQKTEFETAESVVINLSNQELEALENVGVRKDLILGIGGEFKDGSGKDRTVALKHLKEFLEPILKIIRTAIGTGVEVIFVNHSTAGGTGSGIGPALTTVLTSKAFLDSIPNGDSTLVFGIGALPDFQEGTKSFLNSIDCLNDITKAVDKDLVRYFLIRNDFSKATADQKLRITDKRVASMLNRYLTEFGSSRRGSLDRSDRLAALKMMGLHTLVELTEDGSGFVSPFLFHEGTRIKFVNAEIHEKLPVSVFDRIQNLPADDFKVGYHSNEDGDSIIHMAGSGAMRKISETYNNHYKQIKSQAHESASKDLTYGKGFDRLDEEKEFVKSEYGSKGAASVDDALNLF